MRLSDYGRIVDQEWKISAKIRREITLDAFVVMPNHIHGIILINESDVGATGGSPVRSGPRQHSLASFLSGFKSAQRNESMTYVKHPASRFGNEIIMNT
jgi:REP-associated tyrosine transposase